MIAQQPGSVLLHLLLHAQRRIDRAARVILARDRRAEQGEDAIAQRLRDIALVAVHRVHHQPQGWVDQLARPFRVHAVEQGHRTLDVGEQRGNDLAFVGMLCELRGVGMAKTFGQMAGHLGVRHAARAGVANLARGQAGCGRSGVARGRRRVKAGSAFAAELAGHRIAGLAAGADPFQALAAFLAKTRIRKVLTLATCAEHVLASKV